MTDFVTVVFVVVDVILLAPAAQLAVSNVSQEGEIRLKEHLEGICRKEWNGESH